MTRTVIGVFRSESDADKAVSELRFKGFRGDEIGIVKKSQEASGRSQGGDMTGMSVSGHDLTQGVAAGGTIGGLAGLLAGVGAMAIPGIGPVLAAGPLAGLVSGAITGGIAGGLVDLGIPQERSSFYEEEVRKGSILALVKTDEERADKAAHILRESGASDVESHSKS